MENKIIIINWRWNDLLKKIIKLQVDGNKELACYFCNYELKEDLNAQIKKIKAKSTLMLLHAGNTIRKKDIDDRSILVTEFKDGVGPIYQRSDNDYMGIINTYFENYKDYNDKDLKGAGAIPLDSFNFVWYNYTIELEKKKLIKDLLPLAIDIQGMSEVRKNEKVLNKYWEEIDILNTYSDYNLNKGFIICLNKEEAENIKSKFERFKLSEFIKSFNQYRGDSKYLDPKSNMFFPKILSDIVKIIDKRINKN